MTLSSSCAPSEPLQREKIDLQRQLVALMDEIIRIKSGGAFSSSPAGRLIARPDKFARTVDERANGEEEAIAEEGSVIVVTRSRSG